MIKPKEEKFKDAFFFGVKCTLVCPDINKATNTAFNLGTRHRVVTERGELFEMFGQMAGGGRPKSGGMSSKLAEDFTD